MPKNDSKRLGSGENRTAIHTARKGTTDNSGGSGCRRHLDRLAAKLTRAGMSDLMTAPSISVAITVGPAA